MACWRKVELITAADNVHQPAGTYVILLAPGVMPFHIGTCGNSHPTQNRAYERLGGTAPPKPGMRLNFARPGFLWSSLYYITHKSVPFPLLFSANDTFFVYKLVSRHSHAYVCSKDLLATLRAIKNLII